MPSTGRACASTSSTRTTVAWRWRCIPQARFGWHTARGCPVCPRRRGSGGCVTRPRTKRSGPARTPWCVHRARLPRTPSCRLSAASRPPPTCPVLSRRAHRVPPTESARRRQRQYYDNITREGIYYVVQANDNIVYEGWWWVPIILHPWTFLLDSI